MTNYELNFLKISDFLNKYKTEHLEIFSQQVCIIYMHIYNVVACCVDK